MKNQEIENHVRDLIKNDDGSAIELIYNYLGNSLYGYILSMTCSENETADLMNELFLKITYKRKSLASAESLKAYIFVMARNMVMENFRKRKKHNENLKEYELYLAARDDSENTAGQDEILKLQEALAVLPSKQKEVISMKIFQSMTFDDISECLKISINTAASRYRYALNKLKTILKGRENE